MESGINKVDTLKVKDPLLFLTGCVNPHGMAFTELQNPAIRRQHYIESLKFYLSTTQASVLFVENSGTDLSDEFRTEIEFNRLEILTFDGNNYDKTLGKGFGEMLIINYAVQHSKLYAACNQVIKITGRYKVLNILNYLKTPILDQSFISVDLIRSLSICESKFWICNKEFISSFLLGHSSHLNDSLGYYFEHALLYSTFDSIKVGYKYMPLMESPRFSGVYGGDNVRFNESWFNWFRTNLRLRIKNYLIRN
jgi:hypothetical protein